MGARFLALTAALATFLSAQSPPEGKSTSNPPYVPGLVILTFKSRHLPSPDDVAFGGVRFGLEDADSLIGYYRGSRIIKLLPTFGSRATESGQRLERVFLLYFDDETPPTQVAEDLQGLGYFESVRAVKKLRFAYFGTARYIPGDALFDSQWSLDTLDTQDDRIDIDGPEAWAIEKGVSQVTIAIIDQGHSVDTSDAYPAAWKLHPDFNYYFNSAEDIGGDHAIGWLDVDNVDNSVSSDQDSLRDNICGYNFEERPVRISERDFQLWQATPHNGTPDPANGKILTGHALHGVHVASIAASADRQTASVVGVAGGCSVYPIRTTQGEEGIEDPTPFMLAVAEAASRASVINMSWGFAETPDEPFPTLLAVAADPNEYDCVLVAAAGNLSDLGADTLVAWPARSSHVLSVGNMTRLLDRFADSEFDPDTTLVDVVAPTHDGVPVASQKLCSEIEYQSNNGDCPKIETVRYNFGGTSASAPHVSGIAALIRSRLPELTNVEVRARIVSSAEWYWGNSVRKRRELGKGKVNAYRALTEWGKITGTVRPGHTRFPGTGSRDAASRCPAGCTSCAWRPQPLPGPAKRFS